MGGALPKGTLTFLFTDVEGSTKLLEELGAQRYGQELESHREVVRAALASHGGVEVDTQGDAFFCVFTSAPDAVACAQSIRTGLDEAPIRVRMGLHTGEAIVSGDHYVGIDVHRAARVGACGHGGQIVLSATTADMLGVDAAVLRDLGEHRLKDLSHPVRLFQVGDGEFPPLKTLYRTNLPVPSTTFVGREREMVELMDLATGPDAALLTLTGPGGTGKTRLALQVAAELADSFVDGVYWSPLARLRDDGLVASAVAEAVVVAEEAGIPLVETLERRLAGRRMVVLLDNCEHVLEGVSQVVPALLRAGVLVLATSRERLSLTGERVYSVDPLHRADSLELFAGRVEAAGGSVDETPETREAIDALCARLDDLPLAVELAAARAAHLPPAVLLDRLSDRLDLLRGPRDAEDRQRTLHATIAWSYELLEPREQEILRRLAVFAGGGDLEGIEAVCDAELEDVLSLVDKSLVRRRTGDGAAVFWLLETVREFALAELEAEGEAATARDRHLDWFLARARPAGSLEIAHVSSTFGAVLRSRLRELERDVDNLRAAFGWALQRSRDSEGQHAARYEEAAVAIAAALRPFYAVRGRFAEAVDVLGDALPLAKDEISAARLRSWLAQALRGDPERASILHSEAEGILAGAADRERQEWWSAWIDIKLAQAHHAYWANDRDVLTRLVEELPADLEAHGTPEQRVDFLSIRIQDTYRRRRYVLTEESDELAETLFRTQVEVGDWYGEFQRGFYLLWRGKLDDALAQFASGRHVAREVGDAVMEVRCLTYSAVARRKQGDVGAVRGLLHELGELHDLHGYEGLYAANWAWAAWREGDLGSVEVWGAEALRDWKSTGRLGPTVFQWTARFPLLAAELARGDAEQAFEHALWLLSDSQQPLPAELAGIVRDALDTRDPALLAHAVELGRPLGYT